MPVINIRNDRESRQVLLAGFFFNLIIHCFSIMNASKFAFQDLRILDLKPTTKPHWESQGKIMDNKMHLKVIFLFTVVFFLNGINKLKD